MSSEPDWRDGLDSWWYGSTGALAGLAIPLVFLWYVVWRYANRRVLSLAEKIPGPEGYPLIGNALDLTGGPESIFETICNHSSEYKNVMKLWAGPRLIIFLYHPDDVEIILSSYDHINKAKEYKFFKPWLGEGLLISTGSKWKMHRKLIAPTFHLNVLKSFFGLFNTNSKDIVERFKQLGDKEFDCHDYLSETTVEILLETVMGVSKKNHKNAFDYAMAVMKMCDILHLRQTKTWLYPEVIFKLSNYGRMQNQLLSTIHGLTQKVLKIRKFAYEKEKEKIDILYTPPAGMEKKPKEKLANGKDHKSNDENNKYSFGQSAGLKDDLDVNDDDEIGEKKRMAFLDLLLQSSQNEVLLTDEEIQNQVDTIMFEGHDTTAAGTSFFLCMMAAHPHIQDKVIEELDQIFGRSDRDITFQDTLEMKYLERCLMETLRLYPPVPIIARELKEEIKLKSSDVILPAYSTVIIATYRMHRREDIYPNPTKFDPDNFLPENSASRHYYSYIPFSAGPRSCVGRKYAMLKMKVILATILRNFKVKPGMGEKDWTLQGDIILKRTDGFKIQLQQRV